MQEFRSKKNMQEFFFFTEPARVLNVDKIMYHKKYI